MKGFFSKSIYNNSINIKNKIKKESPSILSGSQACYKCGLCNQKNINHPKLKPYGKFEKKILIIGEGPGGTEDKKGKPFHPNAQAGGLLHKLFKKIGLNLYRDTLIINAVDCRPMDKKGNNRTPILKEIQCCLYRKKEIIEKYKPEVILLLGDKAKESFYTLDKDRKEFNSLSMSSLRGKGIPDKNSNAWVYHCYHPSYINRGNDKFLHLYEKDIKEFKKYIGIGHPKFIDFEKRVKIEITEYSEAKKLLKKILKNKAHFVFDYESSSYRYQENIHEIYMVSIHRRNVTYLLPIDHPRSYQRESNWWTKKQRKVILHYWKQILEDETIKKSAQNIKHEHKASHYCFDIETKGWHHDTMIASHILDTAKGTTGLKTQAYLRYGQYNYSIPDSIISASPKTKNKFAELPFDIASKYCIKDSLITNELIIPQRKELKKRSLKKAYKLFHKGTLAYADIELNGIKINVPLAKRLNNLWGEEMEELREKILSSKEAERFKRKYKRPLRYNKKLSDNDIRNLLFKVLKIKSIKKTKGGGESVDEEVLKKYAEQYDCEILNYELAYRKLDKMKNTYLAQFLRYEVDGFIYPSFNLNIADSFRSSSSEPNWHNIPKRTEDASEIRQIVITRFITKDGYLLEVDYGSMEVRIIACVTHDQTLIDYMISGGDMHGDWAEILFKIRKNELSANEFKQYRYISKNHWVFPLFYGSWYMSVAKTTKRPEWFKTQKQWENHLQDCEKLFWKKFKGVREWQKQSIEAYRRNGYIKDHSWGFERSGYLSATQLYNFPIQGPASHCLQWTINRHKIYTQVKTLLCGQIHDALFFDSINKNIPKLREKVDYLMTEKIREKNPWIIVPLVTEWTKGKNWSKMEEF